MFNYNRPLSSGIIIIVMIIIVLALVGSGYTGMLTYSNTIIFMVKDAGVAARLSE